MMHLNRLLFEIYRNELGVLISLFCVVRCYYYLINFGLPQNENRNFLGYCIVTKLMDMIELWRGEGR